MKLKGKKAILVWNDSTKIQVQLLFNNYISLVFTFINTQKQHMWDKVYFISGLKYEWFLI